MESCQDGACLPSSCRLSLGSLSLKNWKSGWSHFWYWKIVTPSDFPKASSSDFMVFSGVFQFHHLTTCWEAAHIKQPRVEVFAGKVYTFLCCSWCIYIYIYTFYYFLLGTQKCSPNTTRTTMSFDMLKSGSKLLNKLQTSSTCGRLTNRIQNITTPRRSTTTKNMLQHDPTRPALNNTSVCIISQMSPVLGASQAGWDAKHGGIAQNLDEKWAKITSQPSTPPLSYPSFNS